MKYLNCHSCLLIDLLGLQRSEAQLLEEKARCFDRKCEEVDTKYRMYLRKAEANKATAGAQGFYWQNVCLLDFVVYYERWFH
jgi:hypothetical protein